MKEENKNIDFEKAKAAGIRFYASPEEKEMAYLEEAMARTDQEKFLYLMNLIKMQRVMKRAKFVEKTKD